MLKHVLLAAAVVTMSFAVPSAQGPQPTESEQIRARQRIATMEEVLKRAVSNGADNVLRQVRNVMPEQPMLAGAPEVRGFRLDGYGIFFDVEVPLMRLPLMWTLRTAVQDGRAAQMVQELRTDIRALPPAERQRLEAKLVALEVQLGATQPRGRQRGVAAANLGAPAAPSVDPDVVNDPENAYTHEVKEALIDAMLDSSGVLTIGADEWLTVAARDNAPRDPLIPGDTVDFSTWIFRVKGSDLAAFRAGRLTAEEARKRVEEREY
jgi:hypothetical protein